MISGVATSTLYGTPQIAKGAGQASIFGMENRAIVPKPSAGLAESSVPQARQNRATSGFSWPQVVQEIIR